MNLKDMILRRKSTRSFTNEPVDEQTLAQINAFIAAATPLYPDVKVRAEIVGRESVHRFLPWTTPQLVAIFSEESEQALVNVGFLFQQLDLYLHTLELGTCWLGMGRLNGQGVLATRAEDGLGFVIMLAFGHPKKAQWRQSAADFKRKPLSAISDQADERLEAARLAPSSVNSQPWYFTHDGDTIHAHCAQQGLFRAKMLSDMNCIDVGIALAHLFVSFPGSFRFFHVDGVTSPKGYSYLGSFSL